MPNLKATALTGASARSDASHDTPRTRLAGALQLGNSDIVAWTNEAYLADVEDGGTTRMRYSRVRDVTIKHFGCSRSTAERAMRDAELLRAADAERRRPTLQARVLDQLHRIADRHEEDDPQAAVGALREVSRIGGLYAPRKLEVEHGLAPPLQLQAIVDILSPAGLAALNVVLGEIEAAKQAGQLKALPAPAVEIVDAVIEDEPEEPGERGN